MSAAPASTALEMLDAIIAKAVSELALPLVIENTAFDDGINRTPRYAVCDARGTYVDCLSYKSYCGLRWQIGYGRLNTLLRVAGHSLTSWKKREQAEAAIVDVNAMLAARGAET
ncbi:MAG: hypothetical protein ACRYHQ_34300 [Janthinobacterium lividum]